MNIKWHKDDRRATFVEGVQWWEFHRNKKVLCKKDQKFAENEAEKRMINQRAIICACNRPLKQIGHKYCYDCGGLDPGIKE